MASRPAPIAGATTGTRMNVAITFDMARAMRSPSNVSRRIARASDRGQAAPKPQTTRQVTNAPSDSARVDATAPRT